jgi:hypothetical protein
LEADLEDDDTYPTCDTTHFSDDDYSLYDEFFSDHGDGDQIIDDDVYAADSKDINVSKYETADIDKVVQTCTHLDQTQQNDLHAVLERYPKLFDHELGTYPNEKIHLDLKEGAVPHYQPRAYSVPHAHRNVLQGGIGSTGQDWRVGRRLAFRMDCWYIHYTQDITTCGNCDTCLLGLGLPWT